MLEFRSFNIDELCCNVFMWVGKYFDLAWYEVFMVEMDGFVYFYWYNYYMLLFVIFGNGSQLIDFKVYDVKLGCFFLMLLGMIYVWEWDEGFKGYVLFFMVDFFIQCYNMNKLYEFLFYIFSYEYLFVDMDEWNYEVCCILFEQMLMVYYENKIGMMSMLWFYVNVIFCWV